MRRRKKRNPISLLGPLAAAAGVIAVGAVAVAAFKAKSAQLPTGTVPSGLLSMPPATTDPSGGAVDLYQPAPSSPTVATSGQRATRIAVSGASLAVMSPLSSYAPALP